MPSIDEFREYSQRYAKECLQASEVAIKNATRSGADYMRQYISEKSPTGTKWHENKSPDGGRVTSGTMLNSVSSTEVNSSNKRIYASFGWIKNRQNYFIDQDSGGYWHTAYGKPSGIGMGLLNTAQDGGGKGTIRVLGAYNYSWNELITEMKKAGFTVSKEGQEVF